MNDLPAEKLFQSHDTSLLIFEDRRKHERSAPPEEGVHVWLKGDQRVRVQLIDESEGGIGVLIPDMSFAIGPFIEIDFNGESRLAVVAYMSKEGDGYRLGLEWITRREV